MTAPGIDSRACLGQALDAMNSKARRDYDSYLTKLIVQRQGSLRQAPRC